MNRNRRWYRLSLSKLLVFLTAACILIAIYARCYHRGVKQQQAVEILSNPELSLAGRLKPPFFPAILTYDFQVDDSAGISSEPSLLGRMFGVDTVHSVEQVRVPYPIDEERARALRDLPGLKRLDLPGFATQDAWKEISCCRTLEAIGVYVDASIFMDGLYPTELNQIGEFPRLRELELLTGELTVHNLVEISKSNSIETLRLQDISVPSEDQGKFPEIRSLKNLYWQTGLREGNDNELLFIAEMPNLKQIYISTGLPLPLRTPVNRLISDSCFRSLSNLQNLECLSLHGTSITGRDLAVLYPLKKLTKLELPVSRLDDNGLKLISRLTQLRHLEIGSTEISDAGMKFVAELGHLEQLSIRDTVITDEGLKSLAELQNLKRLYARDTLITDEGFDAFQQTHPNCLIERGR